MLESLYGRASDERVMADYGRDLLLQFRCPASSQPTYQQHTYNVQLIHIIVRCLFTVSNNKHAGW